MNHRVFGRKLSRSTDERQRLFGGLVVDLLTHGSVQTTIAKAKSIQGMVDKLITTAKKGTQASYRKVLGILNNGNLAHQLMGDAKTRFSSRTSGYTRIIRVGRRVGDAADVVILSLVDAVVPSEVVMTPKPVVKEKKSVVALNEKTKRKSSKKKSV